MRRTAHHPVLAVALVAVLALSTGCGSDDSDNGTEPSPSPSASASVTPSESTGAPAGSEHAVEVVTLLGRNLEAYKQANGKYPRMGSAGYDQVVGIEAAQGLGIAYAVDGAGVMTICVADEDGSASYDSKDQEIVPGGPDDCGV
ncbi:MAG: hypothetical protein JWO76_3016 [Nocardioides sp.]|nr:hypothetical protein [Nocardioides sp.]